ncbi:MAG: tetratricopeptide repeat protein [Ignavibacteriae bacterium]|nr:tetratricopeptide repeat protein [Ignavibacteriota bacterium]
MSDARIAKLQEFLAKDPTDSFTLYALALEYAGRGNTTQAVAMFEALIADDPKYIPAYQQLGYAYQKLNRREDAVAIFQRGIQAALRENDHHAQNEMQEALDELLNN